MSHYMTALAMRQQGLKPAAKIVLYWIADHHNGETGQCNPSIARIASCSEMSRRSVEAHISALEEAGLISVTQCYRDKGGKTSNSYTLCLAGSDAQNLRIPPAKSAHGDAQNLRMMNLGIYNLGKEQDISPSPVFDVFNEIAEQAGWPIVQAKTPARERAAASRIKDCGGFENWKAAMERAAKSDFLAGRATGTTPASFDWLNAPRNFSKVMEGNYDNRDSKQRPTSTGQQDRSDPALENIFRLAGLSQTSGNGGR